MRTIIGCFMLLACLNVSAQIDHWETVVYETDTWKYIVPTSAVPATWNTLTFNDGSWNSGIGGFGFGDGDDNTVISQTPSVYHRIVFSIVDVNAIEQFILNVDYDDGFVAYLNGTEVARSNMSGTGQPPYSQFANAQHEADMYQGNYPSTYQFNALQVVQYLNTGQNVLSIQTHNINGTSSDLSSRVFLHLGINNSSMNYGSVPGWFVAPFVFSDSNLPIVVIDTENGAAIPDEPKIDATMGIIYNGEGIRNYMTDSYNEYFGNIGIETRGSSSQTFFPKDQWGFETRDNFGLNNDITVFNMAWDNDWVLYAPYSDKTLIRNVLAYQMGRDLGGYAPRTKLCEVVLNGEYQGVYVFVEKIKRKDGKVGTNTLNPEDISGNELTGDYILKVDKTTAGGVIAWNSPFPPYTGASQSIGFQLHDPDISELNGTQLNYIQTYITNFETALNGPNFADPITGYQSYIDLESFVDFFLVNEISKNVDGYRISSFLNKVRESEGGKLHAGPVWDFNIAFGNANYCQGGSTSGWELDFYQYCGGDGNQNPFWWKKLLQDPNYAKRVSCKWREMRLGVWHTDSLMQRIDDLAMYLDESQQRNFQKWPVIGTYVWPNNFIGNSYQEEVNYLKQWITDRVNWMDANMYDSCLDLGKDETVSNEYSMFPNPSSGDFTLVFKQEINNGFLSIYDMEGRLVQSESTISGKEQALKMNGLANGIYRFVVQSENKVVTGKIMIQK